jgi:hypothetical protein
MIWPTACSSAKASRRRRPAAARHHDAAVVGGVDISAHQLYGFPVAGSPPVARAGRRRRARRISRLAPPALLGAPATPEPGSVLL